MYLAITVLATVILYYELYIQGAVATKIIADYGMSFTYFVFISVVGNAVGAFASLLAGLADRWGRANLVVGGLLITGVLIGFGLPNTGSKGMYLLLFAIVSFVEGVVLVATPALIRDFSPQVGRGAAMGFWTLGPVLGSLVVTLVSSHTLNSHPDWQFQFHVCGIAGLVVFVIAFLGLRELSPQLRDQLMVSMRDKALIEARAAGLNPEEALKGGFRQMLKPDIIGPAFAISVFLLLYYIAVGFFVVYYATVFGYSEQRANGLANWYWASNAIALVVAGVLSDKVRVRKPFMLIGTAISLVGTALFALAATKPDTGYYTFAVYIILIAVGGGVAYCNWMAAYTETVEKHNPAATATGLAIWGWIIRAVITAALAILTLVVPATSRLVDDGPKTQALAAKYEQQLQTAAAVDPAVLAKLAANPNDPVAGPTALGQVSSKLGIPATEALNRLLALGQVPKADLNYLQTTGTKVQQAQKDNPGQWQKWWWITFAGQIVFLPFVFLLTGRWSPKKAREDELAHEQLVSQELDKLSGQSGGSTPGATARV
jgi:MFS family permease